MHAPRHEPEVGVERPDLGRFAADSSTRPLAPPPLSVDSRQYAERERKRAGNVSMVSRKSSRSDQFVT
jgi:hypothetical protein